MTVTEISIKAKEAGMSYGEYVNQMGGGGNRPPSKSLNSKTRIQKSARFAEASLLPPEVTRNTVRKNAELGQAMPLLKQKKGV